MGEARHEREGGRKRRVFSPVERGGGGRAGALALSLLVNGA